MTRARRARRSTAAVRPGRARRRGVTLIEVVFSSLLLALATGAITSTFSVVEHWSTLDQRRVTAHELAHRLILQYIDAPNDMPDPSEPIGGVVRNIEEPFYYLMEEAILTQAGGDGSGKDRREGVNTNNLSTTERLQSRLIQLTVEVYPDENGKRGRDPLARLVRIYDPFGNPEEDPEAFMQHIRRAFKDDPMLPLIEQALLMSRQGMQNGNQSQAQPPNQPQRPPAAPQDGPRRIESPEGGGGQR